MMNQRDPRMSRCYHLTMTRVLRGHFDGKVIVPDSPVDLPRDQRLVIHVEPDVASDDPTHGTVEYFVKHMQGHEISDEDAELMRAAIEDACERIDPPADIDFDSPSTGHERRD